ncbi:MAG: nucleotidyltransferase domain-containing protein [Nitrospinae bacterium]|nr:nucleotidyltransferase domain-containing protein [Nitrospinota bacterium]
MQTISPSTLDEITRRLVDEFHPLKIILFGSQAAGEADEDSDVDIMVVAETDLPAQERFCAASKSLADYPFAFDVIIKTPEEFRRGKSVVNHIVYFADKYGKVVYERRDG